MYKVLSLTDKTIDPTVYNFKDISGDEKAFTYITNDFHPEWNCNEIIKQFKLNCEIAGIEVIATQLIYKDNIAKEHL